MSSEIKRHSLLVPVPEIITTYSEDIQSEIYNYLNDMGENDLIAYKIAFHHLGTSFNIYKSNGFKEWKQKKGLSK